MRLTTTLLVLQSIKQKRIPGNQYIGKHRVVPNPSRREVNKTKNRIAIEEQNMLVLRHPYLTLEQSWGHSGQLGKPKERIQQLYVKQYMKTVYPNVSIEERYSMLNEHDAWD